MVRIGGMIKRRKKNLAPCNTRHVIVQVIDVACGT